MALQVLLGVAVPLELIDHIAVGVVLVLILHLGGLVVELEGVSVCDLHQLAQLVMIESSSGGRSTERPVLSGEGCGKKTGDHYADPVCRDTR